MIDLRLGDCAVLLKDIPSNSIDLVIIDPPYDLDIRHDGGRLYANKGMNKSNTDIVKANIDSSYDISKVMTELIRVMKEINIYIWCNKKQILEYLNIFVGKYSCNFEIITWHKTNALPTFSNKYLTDTEYCLYFQSGGKVHPKNYEDAKTWFLNPINNKDKKRWKHPTIKPLEIIERFIKNSSNSDDVVLDCFMGSRTTGVACKKLQRNFIGIEINDTYFQTAKDRIENTSINQGEVSKTKYEQVSLF